MGEDVHSRRRERWRLALGSLEEENDDSPEALPPDQQEVDELLEKIYPARREGGLPQDRRFSSRWFKDIGTFFQDPVVEIIQQDLISRLGLKRLLKDPEVLDDLQPSMELVTAILTLKDKLPPEALISARILVQKLAKALEEKLKFQLINRVTGTRHSGKRTLNPKPKDVDWHKTIRANLKHYQPDLRSIIPVKMIGHPRSRKSARRIVIVVDQSASMLESFVHAAVVGSILASIPSIQTHLIIFDTEVVDLSEELDDPVALMFKAQLGGGTDIGKALRYVHTQIRDGRDAYVILISDLFEGGSQELLIQAAQQLMDSSAKLITLLALDDQGRPDYDRTVARDLGQIGVKSLACPPERFPGLIASFLNEEPIKIP